MFLIYSKSAHGFIASSFLDTRLTCGFSEYESGWSNGLHDSNNGLEIIIIHLICKQSQGATGGILEQTKETKV